MGDAGALDEEDDNDVRLGDMVFDEVDADAGGSTSKSTCASRFLCAGEREGEADARDGERELSALRLSDTSRESMPLTNESRGDRPFAMLYECPSARR